MPDSVTVQPQQLIVNVTTGQAVSVTSPGPQGPAGAAGAAGAPGASGAAGAPGASGAAGPSLISSGTSTTLSGILFGDGNSVSTVIVGTGLSLTGSTLFNAGGGAITSGQITTALGFSDFARLGTGQIFTSGGQTINPGNDTTPALILKRHSSTVGANLAEFRDQNNANMTVVSSQGYVYVNGASPDLVGQTGVFAVNGYCGLGGIRMNGADGVNAIFNYSGANPFGISTNGNDVSIKNNFGFAVPGIYLYHSGVGQQRVGLSTSAPTGRLHIVVPSSAPADPVLLIDGTTSQTGKMMTLRQQSSTSTRNVGLIDGVFSTSTDAIRTGRVLLYVSDFNADREAIRADTDGSGANVSLFGAGSYSGGRNVLYVTNCAVAPSGSPTGGGCLFASGGALYFTGSSGTTTKIANA